MNSPSIEMQPVAALRPYTGNARTHSKKQIRQIAESISRFGFTNPILVSDAGEIIAGHGRVMAAKELGIVAVPTLRLSHLSAEERRAYIVADNKLALNAGWDTEFLAIELQALIDIDFDVKLTGFSLAEIDLTLDHARNASAAANDVADLIPELPSAPVSRQGDVWLLGRHRLHCGDARSSDNVARLMSGETADLIFTDPPYNVAIDGNVGGLGSVRHREFAFASGEMSNAEFTEFLTVTLSNASRVSKDGAIAFVCMDWRHMRELLDAGQAAFTELKNLCVWNKSNGGMGSFYRSKHELVFVFKIGIAPHTNSFGLGDTGRYRTNVWDYAGISSLGANRMDELAMHPTVKPFALVADAIKDCSRRNEIVLDLFGGSGSTLIAAESCGRQARLIEYDPAYCDTIIARWQNYTGKRALTGDNGADFDTAASQRGVPPISANGQVSKRRRSNVR
ncbi:site-specific DNA-methyltransferase [Mesorhizobium sp. CO1-1-11]|uniref:site-specific DNA-methyltransferase n=1 Tax=Mesorhizobium sp. CO1-1-11 TaxID=2876636 RepID=UPI001CCB61F2|nr:DNA methyltransferase [Mesorhizobium sp. CO1-1-11]MBZ9727197.1 site-specific DNA-methyltransferase [Mesorhizobium sp. CO1-1-11]